VQVHATISIQEGAAEKFLLRGGYYVFSFSFCIAFLKV
jgi:hypothetical protein